MEKSGGNWAPLLSAFWPGAGQTYNGKRFGPIIMLVYLVNGIWLFMSMSAYSSKAAIAYDTPPPTFLFPAVIGLIMWFWSVYAAFPKKTDREPEPREYSSEFVR